MDATDVLLNDKVGSKLDFFDAASEERRVIRVPLFKSIERALGLRLSCVQFALLPFAFFGRVEPFELPCDGLASSFLSQCHSFRRCNLEKSASTIGSPPVRGDMMLFCSKVHCFKVPQDDDLSLASLGQTPFLSCSTCFKIEIGFRRSTFWL